MIEFSLGKLVLLALIALIVLGPEKLPGAARTAGALLRRVRNGWDSVRAEVERELEVEEIRRAARKAAAEAEAAHSGISDTVQRVREQVRQATDLSADAHESDGDARADENDRDAQASSELPHADGERPPPGEPRDGNA